MRRTTADRQRRRELVDASVAATTPVTEPGPVYPFPAVPARLHALQGGQEVAG